MIIFQLYLGKDHLSVEKDRFRLGRKLKALYINYLAFANDLAAFVNNIDSMIMKTNRLTKVAEKLGFKIFFKTKYMTNIGD